MLISTKKQYAPLASYISATRLDNRSLPHFTDLMGALCCQYYQYVSINTDYKRSIHMINNPHGCRLQSTPCAMYSGWRNSVTLSISLASWVQCLLLTLETFWKLSISIWFRQYYISTINTALNTGGVPWSVYKRSEVKVVVKCVSITSSR
jgi:hypothetical protein